MRTVLRAVSILALTGALVMMVSADASARRAFPANGGSGDASTPDECPRGWYIIGFKGRVGGWIDQIALICARLNPDYSVAERRDLPARGGAGGGPMEINCPRGSVVNGVRYSMTDGWRQVSTVLAQCLALSDGRTSLVTFGNTDELRNREFTMIPQVGKDPVQAQSPENCDAGEAAVGMQINYGRHVNAAGLICDELKRAVAAPSPQLPAPGGKVIKSTGKANSGQAAPPVTGQLNEDRPGSDYLKFAIGDAGECEAACGRNPTCRAWTWVKPGVQGPNAQCYLKNAVPNAVASNCCTSGVKRGEPEAPTLPR